MSDTSSPSSSFASSTSESPAPPPTNENNNKNTSSSATSTTTSTTLPFLKPKRPRWYAEQDMIIKSIGAAYHGEHKLAIAMMKVDNVYDGIRSCDKVLHQRAVGNTPFEKKNDENEEEEEENDFYPSYCGFPFVFEAADLNRDKDQRENKDKNENVSSSLEENFFKAWHVKDESWSVPRSMIHRKPRRDNNVNTSPEQQQQQPSPSASSSYPQEIPATSPLASQKKKHRFSEADILRPWHRVCVVEELPFESEFLLNAQAVPGSTCRGIDERSTTSTNEIEQLAKSIPTENMLQKIPDSDAFSVKNHQHVARKYGRSLWERIMTEFNKAEEPSSAIPRVYPENPKVPIAPGSFQDMTLLQRLHQLRVVCGEVYQNEEATKEQEMNPKALPELLSNLNFNNKDNDANEPFENRKENDDDDDENDEKQQKNSSPIIQLPPLSEIKPDTLPPRLEGSSNIFSLARVLRRCSQFHHEILTPEKIQLLGVHIVRFAGELFKSGVVPYSEVSHDSFALPYNEDRQCCVEQIKFKTFSVATNEDGDESKNNNINNNVKLHLEEAPSDFLKLQILNLRAISEPFKIIVKPENVRMCSHDSPVCGLETKYTILDEEENADEQEKAEKQSDDKNTTKQNHKNHHQHQHHHKTPSSIAHSVGAALAGEFVEYDVDMSDDDSAGSLKNTSISPKKRMKKTNSASSSSNKSSKGLGTTLQTSAAGNANQKNEISDQKTSNTTQQQQQQQQQNEDKKDPNNNNNTKDEMMEINLQLKIKHLDATASFDLRQPFGGEYTPVIKDVEVRLRHFAIVADVKDSPFKTLIAKIVCGALRPVIRQVLESAIASAVERIGPCEEELKRINEMRRRKLFGEEDDDDEEKDDNYDVDEKKSGSHSLEEEDSSIGLDSRNIPIHL